MKSKSTLWAVAWMMMAVAGVQAQQTATTKLAYNPSRIDLYAGYSYFQPHGWANGIPFYNNSEGMVFSGAYYLNRWTGFEAEGGQQIENKNNGSRYLTAGPIFRFPSDDGTSLFAHALAGGVDMTGANVPPFSDGVFFYNPSTWGLLLTAGGGADLSTPLLHHHLGIRVVEVDYQYFHVNYGPPGLTSGGRINLNSIRLTAGLLYRIGSVSPAPPVTYSCSASPEIVFPGDPVTVTGVAANLSVKKPATYRWRGSAGVDIRGDSAIANLRTDGLQAGTYTISGHVSDGSAPGRSADCRTTFTVRPLEPPSLSCAANPITVHSGDNATITADGVSSQNRTLSYSFFASAGTIQAAGNSATLATAGTPTGPISVTCKVQDDRGQSATASATVTVSAIPSAPEAPMAEALCSIQFGKAAGHPARVDNEAKACLDNVALNLERQPDSSLILVANVKPEHRRCGHASSAERAVNTRNYLVKEKGIDLSRIRLFTGTSGTDEVEMYLVPTGVTFDDVAHGATPIPKR